jgi:hypothetical protein
MSKILERLNEFHDMGMAHTWEMKHEWRNENGSMGLYNAKYEESLWLLIWDGSELHAIDSYWDWSYGLKKASVIARLAGILEYSTGL